MNMFTLNIEDEDIAKFADQVKSVVSAKRLSDQYRRVADALSIAADAVGDAAGQVPEDLSTWADDWTALADETAADLTTLEDTAEVLRFAVERDMLDEDQVEAVRAALADLGEAFALSNRGRAAAGGTGAAFVFTVDGKEGRDNTSLGSALANIAVKVKTRPEAGKVTPSAKVPDLQAIANKIRNGASEASGDVRDATGKVHKVTLRKVA